jgi:drug/metabolite transporter (DMT)-like permease
MKWIGVIALTVVGILAAIVAYEYLTLPIHSIPAFLGGKHVRGHYQRRGSALLVLALVAFGGAAYWAVRIRRAERAGDAPTAKAGAVTQTGSADALLSSPESTPEAPPNQ